MPTTEPASPHSSNFANPLGARSAQRTHYSMTFRVELAVYNGPIDLLLYLARRQEVSLMEISLAKVIEQYSDYLELLQELDLTDIGDFLDLGLDPDTLCGKLCVLGQGQALLAAGP